MLKDLVLYGLGFLGIIVLWGFAQEALNLSRGVVGVGLFFSLLIHGLCVNYKK